MAPPTPNETEAALALDAGFRPLQRAAWYRRAQAWLLSRGSRHYDALVQKEKAALFSSLEGTIAEIGPGGGANLSFLRPDVSWIGVEPNPFFRGHLETHARELGRDIDIRIGTAERLPLADHSVDAVISSLVLCSVRDPQATLREVRRVLRPGGRFVFLEHVAARPKSWTRRAQSILGPLWLVLGDGCRVDRDTASAIAKAGFASVDLRRWQLPIPVMGPHISGVAFA